MDSGELRVHSPFFIVWRGRTVYNIVETCQSKEVIIVEVKLRRVGSRRAKSSFFKIFLLTLALLLLFSSGATAAYFKYLNLLKPATVLGSPKTMMITVRAGANSVNIAQLLAEQGLIRSQVAFRFYVSAHKLDDRLQAGEYNLNTGLSIPEIASRLANGETASFTFTIPEGFTLAQIVDRLAERKLVNSEKFMDLVAHGQFDYDFLQGLPEGPKRLEGYLFPDTYQITPRTTEEQIIHMMLTRFSREITPEFKAAAAQQGLTVNQAVIMASVIEREAQRDEERPKVAAVFLNRLKKDWRLESCATIQYALGQPKARLLDKDLQIDSPYNTYRNNGLPPGPIASPGSQSLQAAVNPAKTNSMFFVVFEDGKHIFSQTLQEHNKAKAAYLKGLKEVK